MAPPKSPVNIYRKKNVFYPLQTFRSINENKIPDILENYFRT